MSECLASAIREYGSGICSVIKPEEFVINSGRTWGDNPPDIVLVEATLEDNLLCRMVQHVREVNPLCKLVALVPEHAMDPMFELANIGASGCLFEGAGLSELRTAISTLSRGEEYWSPGLVNALMKHVGRIDRPHRWPPHRGDELLTPREREILKLIASEQLANKQIARRLGLSLYTVKNHVHNIIEKLDVQDRHKAATIAKRHGLLLDAASESRALDQGRIPG